MRAFIVHVGSDGPLFADGASLLLHGGVCGRALGKGDLSAPGPEPDSEGALGCLEERVEASRGAWWGTGRQAQGGRSSRCDGTAASGMGVSSGKAGGSGEGTLANDARTSVTGHRRKAKQGW